MKILNFEEAITKVKQEHDSKPNLLLGNGFSIDFNKDLFSYGGLLDAMNKKGFSVKIENLFRHLKTHDFEVVISSLTDSAKILTEYKIDKKTKKRLISDAKKLKNALAKTIAQNHPAYPSVLNKENFIHCRKFLSYFDIIYTLNYDLLLYWVFMHDEVEPIISKDDGFRDATESDEDYVVWEPETSNKQNVYYMHGALHIFDDRYEIKKFTWSKTNISLIKQIKNALTSGIFPLVVTEGTSKDKKRKINHNAYLSKCYRSFIAVSKSLFTYGLSFSENDAHIVRAIEKGKVTNLYISIFEDPEEKANKQMINRVSSLVARRGEKKPLEITYYNAKSAQLWRNIQY